MRNRLWIVALISLTAAPASAAAAQNPIEPVVVERENFDATVWQTQISPADAVPPPFAHAVIEDLVRIYGESVDHSRAGCAGTTNPTSNWGFEAADPDCRLEVRIDGTWPIPAIDTADQVKIRISPTTDDMYRALGNYLDPTRHDERSVIRSLLHHEHFHTLEWAIRSERVPRPRNTAWWGTWVEGMAMFAQSIGAPEVEDHPTSLFPDMSNGYLANTRSGFCEQGYSAGLFWGFLYWQDGGIDTIRRVIEEIPVDDALGCRVLLPEAVDRALAASPGAHDTFAHALIDFALHAYRGDFRWGRPDGTDVTDWGANLVAVSRALHPLPPPSLLGVANWQVGAADSASYGVAGWGFQHVQIPRLDVYDLRVETDDEGWTPRLLLRNGKSVEMLDLEPGQTIQIDGGAHDEVLVQAIRTAPNPAGITITATPA